MDEQLRDALARPFGPEAVRQKKGQGNRLMDYVSHGMVTKRLNDVAPGWQAEMIERWITETNGTLHCLGGIMRLTIGDVTREEAGGPTRLTTLADDLKNTYSDCLKRCAMRFGVALDMWESADENDEDAAYPPQGRTLGEALNSGISPVAPARNAAPAFATPRAAPAPAPAARQHETERARAYALKQFGPIPATLPEVEAQLAPLAKQVRTNDESLSPAEYTRYHDLEAKRKELLTAAPKPEPRPGRPATDEALIDMVRNDFATPDERWDALWDFYDKAGDVADLNRRAEQVKASGMPKRELEAAYRQKHTALAAQLAPASIAG